MTHFAVVAPPFPSHVRAIEALAAPLLARGHRVTWLAPADVRAWLGDRRIGFVPLGAATHPPGSLGRVIARAARPGGPWGLKRVIADMAAATRMLCEELPAALERLGADAVLADEMEAAGALAAQALGLPYVSVACALPVNREPGLPLPVMPWAPAAGDARRQRLLDESERVHDWLMRPLHDRIEQEASRLGLPRRRLLADCLSPLAQLSQTLDAFDFPRQAAPAHLHHLGPWRRASGEEAPLAFPADRPRRHGQPLVFASLGTLQGGRHGLFRRIARACRAEGVQLVVAHCGLLDAGQARSIEAAGADWVTAFVPQRAMLRQADVAITHAGLNTVMDCLESGTPMLALPIAFDQPGAAARIVHSGTGVRHLPALATVGVLRRSLRRLLDEDGFARRAAQLGSGIAAAGGAARGAALIEAALAGHDARPGASAPPAAASPRTAEGVGA
ncbi:MAG TPA: nucleotide disphospho-sugar-binding domain-containing protein [Ramlibacter sp.]|uniref:glycosyltransferase n=1 Tax=Ramlibacter sp. TaxID=1917967 RepID=UPI002D650EF3|nr:nucleotide disphospho-sugar-binding domain-containing protein [Ramlibacter sp.]HZY19008.1 nucleotide disphospho-sugar-binding domain-containing protein [Ramlibacter sp.]